LWPSSFIAFAQKNGVGAPSEQDKAAGPMDAQSGGKPLGKPHLIHSGKQVKIHGFLSFMKSELSRTWRVREEKLYKEHV
jgi:hypothetical protein